MVDPCWCQSRNDRLTYASKTKSLAIESWSNLVSTEHYENMTELKVMKTWEWKKNITPLHKNTNRPRSTPLIKMKKFVVARFNVTVYPVRDHSTLTMNALGSVAVASTAQQFGPELVLVLLCESWLAASHNFPTPYIHSSQNLFHNKTSMPGPMSGKNVVNETLTLSFASQYDFSPHAHIILSTNTSSHFAY